MSDEVVNALAVKLAAQIARASNFSEIEFSSEARALYESLYERLTEDGDGGLWAAVTSRGEAQVIRLAVTYALFDASPVILVSHLEAAVAAWQYCNDSARFLFGSALTDPTAERIVEVLKSGAKSTTELHKALSGHTTAPNMREALEDLQSRGRIEGTEHKTAGRPSMIWNMIGRELSVESEQTEAFLVRTDLTSQNSLRSQPHEFDGGQPRARAELASRHELFRRIQGQAV